jgi:DNA transformation protein
VLRVVHGGLVGQGKEGFFFEKKEPKNFLSAAARATASPRQRRKSFCFFFQKEALSVRVWSPAMERSEIEEMFAALGPVTIRRMFGGKGVYVQGSIVAVEFQGDILLKADDISAPQFAAAGAVRWEYEGKAGKSVYMPYWSVPAEAFDDPDSMAHWVKLAHAAALRAAKAAQATPKRKKRG